MDRRCEFGEAFVHAAPSGYEPCFVFADECERAEAIHLQLEEVVLMIKSIAAKHWRGRDELRIGNLSQCNAGHGNGYRATLKMACLEAQQNIRGVGGN